MAGADSSGPVVTDGAWGTQLQARGLGPGDCPDAWNLAHPDRVEEVARAYVEAGSRVILTNTFGASRLALAGHGLDGKAAEINRAGARISKGAAAGRAKVFASIGPTGKLVAMGEADPADVRAAFAEQARALAEGGADGIVVETLADIEEARLAVSAARETGLPVAACMVFDSGPSRDRTMMGVTPEQAAAALEEAGADIVGANCGRGIEGYVEIARRLRAATRKPVWIKPNAGLPEREGDRVVYRTTPEDFAARVPALVGAGADYVGGCCGTSPAFIAAVVRALGR